MMLGSGMADGYWAGAAKTFTNVSNLTPRKKLNYLTPWGIFTKKPPLGRRSYFGSIRSKAWGNWTCLAEKPFIFRKSTELVLSGMCDASWGEDLDDRKSQAGYVLTLGDTAVS